MVGYDNFSTGMRRFIEQARASPASRWSKAICWTNGLAVAYCRDGDPLLGTGGAIKKALPQLGDVFMVLYGDSYLPIAFAPVADAFRASRADGLMTVFRNDGRWDTSNVEFGDGAIGATTKFTAPPPCNISTMD